MLDCVNFLEYVVEHLQESKHVICNLQGASKKTDSTKAIVHNAKYLHIVAEDNGHYKMTCLLKF